MGMRILTYCLFLLGSLVLAVPAAWFKCNYGREQADWLPFAKALRFSRRFLIMSAACFAAIAALYLTFYQRKDLTLLDLTQCLLVWDIFFVIAAIDFRLKKIPNLLILLLLAIRTAFLVLEIILTPSMWFHLLCGSLVGMLAGGLVILACMFISRGGVGAGDMKLYATVGLFFGLAGVMNVMLNSLLLAAFASIILLMSHKAKMKSALPMAPFVFAGLNVYFILM